MAPDAARRFNQDGFLIVPEVLSESDREALAAELAELFQRHQSSARRRIGGLRNILQLSPAAAAVARSSKLISLIEGLTGRRPIPVKATLFDKTSDANWLVPWHQDLAVAVARRIDTPAFDSWSVKDGVVHVQPPLDVLREMIAVRLHLDDCFADNGALRVMPGSHLHGELSADDIASWTARHNPVICPVPRGGILLMKPLLLHASSAALRPLHRRVLHIEYAASELPNGLRWFEWA